MSHPQMFDDDDPYLARVRAICLRFPGAEEFVSHGRPSFRTRKVFLTYGGGVKGAGADHHRFGRAIIVEPDEAERPALEADPHYFLPAYYGPFGWIGWDLAHGGTLPDEVDWAEVGELVDASYRRTAPRALVRELDAESAHGG